MSGEFRQYLGQRIKATGAITVAEYMKECLTNPMYGYYTRKNPIGRQGDFITSPEVCQIFGELLTLWCINEWAIAGAPTAFQIIELGPGSGILASDILRIASSFAQVRNHFTLHLVERSPALAGVQAQRLGIVNVERKSEDAVPYQHGVSQYGVPVSWYLRIQDIPKAPAFIVANEFFDALPIHKFQKTENGFREVMVDLNRENGQLMFALAPQSTPATRLIPSPCKHRDHLEFSLESAVILDDIADRVADCGGGALIIDYGHEGTKGDTFRGFREHRVVDALDSPGGTDLTADVDFSILKALLKPKAVTFGPILQYEFLANMAFERRFDALMRACRSDSERQRLESACDVLINPAKMGGQFFAFAVVGKSRSSLGQLSGFTAIKTEGQ
ncbi:protein arginine methyltransferase NDUFAF7, mitochondrial-like isoform X2 [Paramacrobiotus metropolitanus]|nr:protein arginine methyltransferase NDUFAF7, mitochondrial-like isoform X2 [Paramacrobiotus metropolitanus]